MKPHQVELLDSLDKLSEKNRTHLVEIVATYRHRYTKSHSVWGADPLNMPEKPWKLRIFKMIRDLCWFYDRMEGHESGYLVPAFDEFVKNFLGEENANNIPS